MAKVTKKQAHRNALGSTPWGNLSALRFVLETNAAGAALDASSDAPLAIGDVVVLGQIPAGFRVVDSAVIVSEGMTATITGDLGFAYNDGVDSATVPQDAVYFGAGLNLATAAHLRKATSKGSVLLPKDADLTLKVNVAANAKASKIEVIVYAIAEGVATAQ
ncbi:hypothetical protein E8K88_02620 [Lampropedia aestuarii]|uniref:Uncharacterized protein n=1 Tax=Lampropedia aestuarii TaxID=2562762 RepID=A0A4S5C199_9BURK|nr:hypothetical protein [Lampropedia aestuarii]THJ36176.1 hypothetical protein E8K88_02620 [Lampropedia aestuarii]